MNTKTRLSGGRKPIRRKVKQSHISSSQSISLNHYVNKLLEIYSQMIKDPDSDTIRTLKPIKSFFEPIGEAKKAKLNPEHPEFDTETKQDAYIFIINSSFAWFETQKIKVLFPKELLKYFLATYKITLKAIDFQNTSGIMRNNMNRQNDQDKTVYKNGDILSEYAKPIDAFKGKLSNCDSDDLEALKFIIENGIEISNDLYNNYFDVKLLPDISLNVDYELVPKSSRQTHSRILISSTYKQSWILITRDLFMVFDGREFSLASVTAMEDEISTIFRQSINWVEKDDFIMLDIIFATKMKVIDLVAFKLGSESKLCDNYCDRLKFVQKIIPKISIVDFAAEQQVNDYSYIDKSNDRLHRSFIHYKHNLTAAIVGISDSNALIAFINDNNDLVVKSKTLISGPVSHMILLSKFQKQVDKDKRTILINDKRVNLIHDLDNVHLFEKTINVQLKEANKLGSKSIRPISNEGHYKTTNTGPKTDVTVTDFFNRYKNNLDKASKQDLLRKIFSESDSETLEYLNNYIKPKIETTLNFDEYNVY